MLKRCCCFDLRTGSVLIGALRLISWLVILIGVTYVVWQLFVLGHRGMVPFTVMQNLEENGKKPLTKITTFYNFILILVI